MQTIRIQTAQNIELHYELAGVGDRVVAYIIDLAIYFAYYILIMLLHEVTHFIDNAYIAFASSLPVLFYSLFCETFLNGQTIGKKARRIRVISLDGGQASFGQYLARWVFSLVDILFSSGVVAVVMVALTDKNQRLGDLVAGTTVVRTDIHTDIQDTIFVETAEEYHPVYPQVTSLSEKDIALIKEVINRNIKFPNYALLEKTADKVKSVLAINDGHEAHDFLQTVVKDYNYLTAN